MTSLNLALLKADTDLHAVCRELGFPYKHVYIAFYRCSVRGRAGEYRRAVLKHLFKRIRTAHRESAIGDAL